jgi:multicomponent Na+:H+ antiporter subunit G
MGDAIDLLSWFCFLTGGALLLSGGLGLLRFPDFHSRVHAAGVADTLAAPLLLLGLILQMGWSLASVKVLMIIFFLLATNPTAAHAMVKAAEHGGHRPLHVGTPPAKEGPPSKS